MNGVFEPNVNVAGFCNGFVEAVVTKRFDELFVVDQRFSFCVGVPNKPVADGISFPAANGFAFNSPDPPNLLGARPFPPAKGFTADSPLPLRLFPVMLNLFGVELLSVVALNVELLNIGVVPPNVKLNFGFSV